MSEWRVTLWRRDAAGKWCEMQTYPGDQVATALDEVNRLNAIGPDLYAALPAGEVPTT